MIRRHCVLAALALAAVSLAGGTHAVFAADKVCKLAIAGNDAMQYDKKELDVAAACTQVALTLTPTDPKLRDMVAFIRILGQQTAIREIDTTEADGDRTTMAITPEPR